MCWGTIWKDNILYLLKLDHFAGRQSAPQPLPRLQLHLQPSVQVIMTTEMLLKNQYFRISLDFTCYFVWLRQDSELQSVSSHNDTTDDNQSSFTESSSHYSNTYRWQLLESLLLWMPPHIFGGHLDFLLWNWDCFALSRLKALNMVNTDDMSNAEH